MFLNWNSCRQLFLKPLGMQVPVQIVNSCNSSSLFCPSVYCLFISISELNVSCITARGGSLSAMPMQHAALPDCQALKMKKNQSNYIIRLYDTKANGPFIKLTGSAEYSLYRSLLL